MTCRDVTYTIEVGALRRSTAVQTCKVLGRNSFGIAEAFGLFDLSLLVKQEHALILTIAVSCSQEEGVADGI